MSELPVSGWNRVARVVHWGTALAVLVEVPVGFAMAWTYIRHDPAGMLLHLRSSQVHHTLGLGLLAVVAFRLFWRLSHASPPPPAGAKRIEVALAATVQGLLYLLLLAIPLSGWAALSSLGAGGHYQAPPMWFFGVNGFGPGGFIPHIVPPVAWNAHTLFKYGLFARIHRWGLILGGALLVLHIAGALKQHFIARTDVFTRMWRGMR